MNNRKYKMEIGNGRLEIGKRKYKNKYWIVIRKTKLDKFHTTMVKDDK